MNYMYMYIQYIHIYILPLGEGWEQEGLFITLITTIFSTYSIRLILYYKKNKNKKNFLQLFFSENPPCPPPPPFQLIIHLHLVNYIDIDIMCGPSLVINTDPQHAPFLSLHI